ncbi:Fc.00g024960.m01.CDS01 [Cosmosporella sp. VM-42]
MEDAVSGERSAKPSPPDLPNHEGGSLVTESSWQQSPPMHLTGIELSGELDVLVGDPIARGLITHDLARNFYSIFYKDLAPQYPLVLPPEPSTWQNVRITRPVLFQAAITAAAGTVNPTVSEILFQNTEKMLAERVVLGGEKCLDLVQALLILSTWVHPPKRFRGLKFSQHSQMAATMVMDLRSSSDPRYKLLGTVKPSVSSPEVVEVGRTFSACFFFVLAMSLRRQSMLPYGSWVDQCTEILERAPVSHLNDRRLLSWVGLQKLAQDGFAVLGLDQESPENVHLCDSRTQYIINGCVDRLGKWRQSVSDNVMSETLELHYHTILTGLYEKALHDQHNLDDFRPPYTIRSLHLIKNAKTEGSPEVDRVLARCIGHARTLLQTFLRIDVETLRSIPVISYTRMTYAVVVLIKSYVSLRMKQGAHSNTTVYDGNLAPTMTLRPLVEKLALAAGEQQLRVPTAFHHAMSNITLWCIQNLENGPFEGHEDLIEPMMHLGVKETKGTDSQYTKISQNLSVPPMEEDVVASNLNMMVPGGFSTWEDSMCAENSWINVLDQSLVLEGFGNTFDFSFQNPNSRVE